MKLSHLILILFFTILTAAARACDLCGCYTPNAQCAMYHQAPQRVQRTQPAQTVERGGTEAGKNEPGAPEPGAFAVARGLYFGAAEQFTHFGTMQFEGRKVPNETGQRLESSITQLFAGYTFFDQRFALQVNVPLIYRSFKRPEGFQIDRGTESGLGDVSLIGSFVAWRKESANVTGAWKLLGGVKFPTGSSSRLHEELHEIEVEGAPASGIHGHDLTLGTGSYDGIVGTSAYLRYKRAFFAGAVQYSIRSTGDIGYRFANDLTWSFGPGVYLHSDDLYSVSLRASVSGEHKDVDTFRGEPAEDTGVTAWYVGPEISATWRDRLSAELGVDLPVSIRNTALQAVPDYKLRAAVVVRF
jgi:hypothetical protein